jgi:hypothetical protein
MKTSQPPKTEQDKKSEELKNRFYSPSERYSQPVKTK